MISLFSSFDLHFFPFSISLVLTFMINLISKTYKINRFNHYISYLLRLLERFFLSLKINSFNKNFSVIFVTLFFFLLFVNITSVFSFNFALFSQISLVMLLGLSIWLSFNLFLNFYSIKGFLSHCVPEGAPIYLIWFLFLIEIIRSSIRPLTVSVRLVANILAGHLLIILLSKLFFIFNLILPLYVLLNLVEIFVALIQSYIFRTMLVLYYSDVS